MTISTNGTCWYPDGVTIATYDSPCNDTAAAAGIATPCCNSQHLCMANGLCLNWAITSRGSCTDSAWGEGCTQYCQDENTSQGARMRVCDLDSDKSTFACGDSLSNCEQGVNTFSVTSYTLSVARETQLASLASAYGAAVVATTAGSSSTLALSSSGATASSSAASSSGDAFSSGEMAGVGVGVGVPLALACVALAWLWRREVGRSKGVRQMVEQQQMQQQQYQQQYQHAHYHQQQVPYHEIGTDGERAELPPK
ncbi:hypothetical protein HDK77DRAFT_483989 [Phyllosticta capitalensis]